MADRLDIMELYIQMREGNNLREQADLALIKQLVEERNIAIKERDEEHRGRMAAEAKAKQLEEQIRQMQSVRPIINNIEVKHDYIEKQVVGL